MRREFPVLPTGSAGHAPGCRGQAMLALRRKSSGKRRRRPLEGPHGAEILIPGLAELAFDHHGLGGKVDIGRRVPGGGFRRRPGRAPVMGAPRSHNYAQDGV